MQINTRSIAEICIVSIIGAAVIVVPVANDPSTPLQQSPFLPLIAAAVEGMKAYSLGFIGFLGIFSGFFMRSPAWILGLSSMVFFPVWSLINIIIGGEPSLLGNVWGMYIVVALFGVVGAIIGRYIFNRRNECKLPIFVCVFLFINLLLSIPLGTSRHEVSTFIDYYIPFSFFATGPIGFLPIENVNRVLIMSLGSVCLLIIVILTSLHCSGRMRIPFIELLMSVWFLAAYAFLFTEVLSVAH